MSAYDNTHCIKINIKSMFRFLKYLMSFYICFNNVLCLKVLSTVSVLCIVLFVYIIHGHIYDPSSTLLLYIITMISS